MDTHDHVQPVQNDPQNAKQGTSNFQGVSFASAAVEFMAKK
jgi:hypothetical protein